MPSCAYMCLLHQVMAHQSGSPHYQQVLQKLLPHIVDRLNARVMQARTLRQAVFDSATAGYHSLRGASLPGDHATAPYVTWAPVPPIAVMPGDW